MTGWSSKVMWVRFVQVGLGLVAKVRSGQAGHVKSLSSRRNGEGRRSTSLVLAGWLAGRVVRGLVQKLTSSSKQGYFRSLALAVRSSSRSVIVGGDGLFCGAALMEWEWGH